VTEHHGNRGVSRLPPGETEQDPERPGDTGVVAQSSSDPPALGSPLPELKEERKVVSILCVDLVGFVARSDQADPARARHDSQLVDQYRAVLDEILKHFAPDSLFGRLRPYGRGELETLEAEIVRGFSTIPRARQQLVERTLSLCADLDHVLTPEAIRPIVESAAADGLTLLEAQGRRVLGIAVRDLAELTRALDIFEETHAAPYAARVRCERALLTRDQSELEAGMHVLETLGDLDQLAQVERARSKSRGRS
jgi:hypothetical protein